MIYHGDEIVKKTISTALFFHLAKLCDFSGFLNIDISAPQRNFGKFNVRYIGLRECDMLWNAREMSLLALTTERDTLRMVIHMLLMGLSYQNNRKNNSSMQLYITLD